MNRMRVLGLAALALLLLPMQAMAEWRRAESDHFVIYSDRSEAVLRDYVLMLEDFDALLRSRHADLEEIVKPPKLDVYLIGDRTQLRRVWPTAADWTAGFYTSSSAGMFAVAMRDTGSGWVDATRGDDFVLHEYVHHFMMQYHKAAYPAWLVEGYAEYYATVDLGAKRILIGSASDMRASSITAPAWLGMDKVLASQPSDLSNSDKDGFYAQSWLLTHYIMSDAGRRQKLNVYLREWRQSGDSIAAWKTAFGEDPAGLRKSLDRYRSKPLMGGIITRKAPFDAKMSITRLSSGADDVLLETLQLQRPVAESRRAGLLERMRAVHARKTDDRYARLAAALAETRLGDRDAGEAILKTMIADDASDHEAMRLLAESYLARGQADAEAAEKYFNMARPLLAAAVRLAPEDFRPYMLSARMRLQQDRGPPSENTLNVLLRAVQLAPQVRDLRFNAALAFQRIPGTDNEVRHLLEPLLGDPHGGEMTTRAKAIIARLDGKEPAAEVVSPGEADEEEEG